MPGPTKLSLDVLVHTVASELLPNELWDWACQHENIPSFLFRFVKVARRHFPMSLCSHAANQKVTATWWPRKLVKLSLCEHNAKITSSSLSV